jgi:hypothetical protein
MSDRLEQRRGARRKHWSDGASSLSGRATSFQSIPVSRAALLLMGSPLFSVLCWHRCERPAQKTGAGVIARRHKRSIPDARRHDGGGQPHGLSLAKNIAKECPVCWIPEALA